MAEGYQGLPAYYFESSDPLTPNLGLSLKGMDPIIAANFVTLDSSGGGTLVSGVIRKVTNITAVSVASGVLTVNAPQDFAVGDGVSFFDVAPASFLNGQTLTVLSATSTSFTCSIVHPDYSLTDQTNGTCSGYTYTPKQSDSGKTVVMGNYVRAMALNLDPSVLTAGWTLNVLNLSRVQYFKATPVPPSFIFAGSDPFGPGNAGPFQGLSDISLNSWQSTNITFDGTNFWVSPVTGQVAQLYSNFSLYAGAIVIYGGEQGYCEIGSDPRSQQPFGVAMTDTIDNQTVLVQTSGTAWVSVGTNWESIDTALTNGFAPITFDSSGNGILAEPGQFIVGFGMYYDSTNTAVLVAICPQYFSVWTGIGAPNGHITGSPGAFYVDRNGGASTTLYVKESGLHTNTGWVAYGGGGGTVTTFSAGNLSPLFTTNVSNPTTTPALSFSLSNAGGGTVFGNNGSGSGAPAYTTSPVLGIPGTSTGSIGLASSTASGLFTITAPADPSIVTLTLPNESNILATQLFGDGTIFLDDFVQADATGTISLPAPLSQNANLVFAGPTSGGAATPTFRSLVLADLPAGIGTVSSFSAGDLSPLFTSSVSNPTTTPALSFSLSNANANTVFAGPTSGGAAGPTFRALVTADIPSGIVTWDRIGNAAGNLTLSNGTNTTEFDQTSNTTWKWYNTTTATSGTTNASPVMALSANYWTGAASAEDKWTLGSSLAAGTNGQSTLKLLHTGSAGAAGIQLPATAPSAVAAATLFDYNGAYLCYSGSGGIFLADTSVNFRVGFFNNSSTYRVAMNSGGVASWTSSSTAANASADTGISRQAAGVVAIGTGASGDTTGNLQLNKITKYNGETTAGIGSTYVRAVTAQKAETGADSNVLTLTPASAAGVYRVTIVMAVSSVSSATGFGWTATWKDSNGQAQAPTNLSLFKDGTAAPALTYTAAANATYEAEALLDVDASGTNIVVKTTFSGTSIAYKVSAVIERIA